MCNILALWYYHNEGRTAISISFERDSLDKLQKKSENDKNSLYNYCKNELQGITIEPIDIYEYDNMTNKLILLYDDEHEYFDKNNFYLYALESKYNDLGYINDFESGENLIYLRKEIHDIWKEIHDICNNYSQEQIANIDPKIPSFFYTKQISTLPVKLDFYYDRGIIMA
jgi:hypothetical protein